MASKDVYLISSSPPRQFKVHTMSSPLLSPNKLLNQKTSQLRRGSNAAAIPADATTLYTSASTPLAKTQSGTIQGLEPLRSFKLGGGVSKTAKPKASRKTANKDDLAEGEVTEAPRKPAKENGKAIEGEKVVKKPGKSRAKKVDVQEGAVKEKAPPKPRAKKSGATAAGDSGTKEKAVRKSQVNKVEKGSQTTIAKGRVTKNTSSTKLDEAKEATKLRKAEVVSRHFEGGAEVDSFTDYGLEAASTRRTDWTPVKATAPGNGLDIELTSGGSLPDRTSKGFGDLLGSFGFSNGETSLPVKKMPDLAATRKRKLIELVKTNVSNTTPAAKEKTLKKKARTLTDQAMSAYVEDGEAQSVGAVPLLQNFQSNQFKVPAKPRSNSPAKKIPKVAKKGTAAEPILLSPESALKQVGNQDFVFGTSSQLAREESPTLLKDLHDAMQASNALDDYDDPFATPPSYKGRSTTVALANRNLWSAATRDEGGQLLEIETVDLARSSPAIHGQSQAQLLGPASSVYDSDNESVWHDIEDLVSQVSEPTQSSMKPIVNADSSVKSQALNNSPPNFKNNQLESSTSSHNFIESELPAKSTTKTALKPVAKVPEKPNFDLYTDFQLTKEIASYKFKPVKKREQMIALLERCWEGKQRVALGLLQTNIPLVTATEPANEILPPPTQAKTASPKKPHGRPKNGSAASALSPKGKARAKTTRPKAIYTVAGLELDSDTPLSMIRTPKKSQKQSTISKKLVEDISDSDNPFTPSPPRRHPSQLKNPPTPLRFDVEDSPELSPSAEQALLFTHITNAVTIAPPTKDPSNPSWHEKILMYDPIILEDLTVWLNTGALDKAGWDGEVDPKQVKKWCESNSICCLWKDNLRGGARARH